MNMRQDKQPVATTASAIEEFETLLRREGRSTSTVAKHTRDLRTLFSYLDGQEVDKDSPPSRKEYLMESYAPASVNSMPAIVNTFLDFTELMGWEVEPLKIQQEIFSRPEKELTREEYRRLVAAVERKKNCRLSLLLQIIYATGIRVSGLPFITAETLQTGRTLVDCKGKTRTVFLPASLVRALHNYCRKQRAKSGTVFCTKNGKPIDRSSIWRDMKALCESAGVVPEKALPHNPRYLFTRAYRDLERDLSKLADLLGRVNISTTGIYTMENGGRHAEQLDKMGLVLIRLRGRQHSDDYAVGYNEINELLHTKHHHIYRKKARNHHRASITSTETRWEQKSLFSHLVLMPFPYDFSYSHTPVPRNFDDPTTQPSLCCFVSCF